MNSEWSLDELYKGFDDPKFVSDFAKVDELVARNNELAEKIKDMDGKEAVLSYINLTGSCVICSLMQACVQAQIRRMPKRRHVSAD